MNFSTFAPAIPSPDIVSYRAMSSQAPTNTMASLRQALSLGVKHIMIDVQACGDGELVLFHDLTFDCKNAPCFVQYSTLSALSKVDLGAGQRVLTLSDVLNYIPDEIELIIRVVGRHTLQHLLNFFQEFPYQRQGQLWFVSGDQLMLHSLSLRIKRAKCAAMISGLPLHDLSVLLHSGIQAVIVDPQEVNSYMASELRAIDIDLWISDVRCHGLYERCLEWMARKIISHNPAFLYECQEKRISEELLIN